MLESTAETTIITTKVIGFDIHILTSSVSRILKTAITEHKEVKTWMPALDSKSKVEIDKSENWPCAIPDFGN